MTDEIAITDEELIECAGSLGPQVRLAWALAVAAGRHVAVVELIRQKAARERHVTMVALDERARELFGPDVNYGISLLVDRLYSVLRNKYLKKNPYHVP